MTTSTQKHRGAFWGMLFGGAFRFFPALGSLVIMSPLVGWIVPFVEGSQLATHLVPSEMDGSP